MKIAQSTDDGVTLFHLDGHLDSTTSAGLQTALMPAAQASACQLAIDFSDVDYVSSAGLRIILMAAKQARASAGKLAVFGLKNPVREAFEISGFATIISIADTQADAISAVKA